MEVEQTIFAVLLALNPIWHAVQLRDARYKLRLLLHDIDLDIMERSGNNEGEWRAHVTY